MKKKRSKDPREDAEPLFTVKRSFVVPALEITLVVYILVLLYTIWVTHK